MKACIDTNVLYNILFKTEKTGRAKALLAEYASWDLYITTTIYNELLYTATVKLLDKPGPKTLRRIIASKGCPKELRRVNSFLDEYGIEMLIETVDRTAIYEAVERYKLLPSDAIIALTCRSHGIDAIISLDEDFDRIPWLQRIH